nr:acyltransferase [Hyphomonas sp. Mor2]
MQQLNSVQALRAIAALAVMFAHLQGLEAQWSSGSTLLSPVWIAGVSGVDLFFVISGFIMVWIASDWADGPNSSLKFMFSRILRIYPLWWLFAALTAAYFFVSFGLPWDADRVVESDGPMHLVKSFLLLPQGPAPVLTLGWTLIHEMYFYLVFALVLLLPVRFRKPAFVVWALLITASTVFQWTGFFPDTLLSLALFPLTLEFLMGSAVAWLILSGFTRFAIPALTLGLIVLLFAILTVDFTTATAWQPTHRMLAYGPAYSLIVYGVVSLERRGRLDRRIPNSLVTIGNWSYSLYLCHILVITALARVFFPIFDVAGLMDNFAFLALASAAALIVSGLTYTYFEKPIVENSRKMRQRIFNPIETKRS